MAPLVRRLARHGTVWPPSPLTLAYLALLLLVLLGTIAVWFLPWPVGLRFLAFVVGLVLLGVVASSRGLVVSRAFATGRFSLGGSPTALSAIATTLDHVLFSADLHTGEKVYTPAASCARSASGGVPGDLPLHVAVQCSEALPGVMPPRWLPTGPHGFAEGQPEAEGAARMALVEGGVYDNMADQWGLEIGDCKARCPSARRTSVTATS